MSVRGEGAFSTAVGMASPKVPFESTWRSLEQTGNTLPVGQEQREVCLTGAGSAEGGRAAGISTEGL